MELWLDPPIRQTLFELVDIRPNPGKQHGVDHRGAGPGVFPEFRADLGRQDDRETRAGFRENFPCSLFMQGIAVGMQIGDRNCFDALRGECPPGLPDTLLIQRNLDRAVRPNAARNAEAVTPGHQRPGLCVIEMVEIRARLVCDFEHVPETLGRKQSCGCAAALDDGVGRNGRAMHDEGELTGLNSECGERLVDSGYATAGGIRRHGGDLRGQNLPSALLDQNHIGKGSPDIDADPVDCFLRALRQLLVHSSGISFMPPGRGQCHPYRIIPHTATSGLRRSVHRAFGTGKPGRGSPLPIATLGTRLGCCFSVLHRSAR